MDSWINWGNTKPKRRLNPWEQYDGSGTSGYSGQTGIGGAGGYVNAGRPPNNWGTAPNTLSGESIGIDRGPAGFSEIPVGPGVKLPLKPPRSVQYTLPGTGATPGNEFGLPGPYELGPGGQPYHGPGSGAGAPDNSWQNWWTGTGLPGAYNPNWSITAAPGADGDETQAETAAFLSWMNAMMPYLSAKDRQLYAQQALTNIDSLSDENASKYWSGLANQFAPSANSASGELGSYWDRERLREMRRANREFWNKYYGEEASTGWEPGGMAMQSLLTSILGTETAGGNEGALWAGNGPMSRRMRQGYNSNYENYASGLDQNTYGALLQSLMYPTTNSPRLNAYFRAPSTYQGSYPGSSYGYGSQNVRWV